MILKRMGVALAATCSVLTLSLVNASDASASVSYGEMWNDSPSVNECLGVINDLPNANAIMWHCNGNADQQWHFVYSSAAVGSYALVNNNGSCLEGWGKGSTVAATTSSGCDPNFGISNPNMGFWASYIKTDGGVDYYELRSDANTGLCLSVSGGSTANGATPIMWTCQGTADQLWGGPALSTRH
jgi:hypothetical protein